MRLYILLNSFFIEITLSSITRYAMLLCIDSVQCTLYSVHCTAA